MNVLSLFDGMSCGRIALERAGIKVDNYFASEIDTHAIKVSKANWDDITHVGDVTKLRYVDGVLYTEMGTYDVGRIDLVIAGSPCQGFSLAGGQLGLDDPRSKLYFEFERLLEEVSPRWWLLENVRMKVEFKEIISSRLGVQPIPINSSLVCAQNRPRLYWMSHPQAYRPLVDKNLRLVDILQPNEEVDDKYYVKAGRLRWLKEFGEVKEKKGYVAFNPTKAKCLTVRPEPSWNCTYILQWPRGSNRGGIRGKDGKVPCLTPSSWQANNLLLREGLVRKLTPVECERLQTVPDNYTSGVSDTQRYKMLGNGWTVDVIAHLLNCLVQEDGEGHCVA